MKKLTEIVRSTDTLYVYWTLTDLCNFKCSYCPDDLHVGTYARSQRPGFPTDIQIDTFIDNVLTKHLNGRFLNMTISGGEPTLHPKFKTIIERMSGSGSIEVVTNGSRSADWWRDMKSLPDKVTISLHPEFSKLEKINELGLFLLENDVDLVFNLMCDPDNWDWVINVKNSLDATLHNRINAKILTDHSNGPTSGKPFDNYYQEQLDFIKVEQSRIAGKDERKRVHAIYDDGSKTNLNAFDLINAGQNSFTGWSCSAGRDGIRVSFDGSVYAVCGIKRLGKIDTFALIEKDITCPQLYCKAASGITINKRAPTLTPGQ